MENNTETNPKIEMDRQKESPLVNFLSVMAGLGLGALHSHTFYKLMDKAGMYEPSGNAAYPNLATFEGFMYQTAGALGTAALTLGGLYVCNKALRWIRNRD